MNLKQSLRLAAGFAFGVAMAHAGLIITPTFDPSITGDPGKVGIEAAINGAIAAIEGDITSPNNITVKIYFTEMNSGLSNFWMMGAAPCVCDRFHSRLLVACA